MPTDTAYPHITKTDDRPARLERIPRVRVAQVVMDYLAHGWSPEEMCRQHPELTISEAHAAMLYYWDHRGEIDGEIRAEWAEAERSLAEAPLSPFLARLRRDRAS